MNPTTAAPIANAISWVGLGRVDHGGARNLIGCSYGQNLQLAMWAVCPCDSLTRHHGVSSNSFPSIANQGRMAKAGFGMLCKRKRVPFVQFFSLVPSSASARGPFNRPQPPSRAALGDAASEKPFDREKGTARR
jgi:hypothetical protein